MSWAWESALEASDEGRVGKLRLDHDFRILAADATAGEILAAADVLLSAAGALAGVGERNRASLARLRADPQHTLLAFELPGQTGEGVTARFVPQADGGWLVRLRRLSPAADPPKVDLSAFFGLSNAEGRVLNEMLRAGTSADSAQSLGISAETIRTHKKRIYAKLGGGGRAGVSALLQRFWV